jgi:hypothetical protein
MQSVKATLDQLKQQGIVPRVVINLPADNPDIPKAKALQAELKNAGVIAEFHLNLDLGASAGEGKETDGGKDSFEVVVTEPHANCFTFKQTNSKGIPLMAPRKPAIQIKKDQRFKVSATARIGPKDAGDGLIIADGGTIFYLVTECKSNPLAEGFYVRQVDVARL